MSAPTALVGRTKRLPGWYSWAVAAGSFVAASLVLLLVSRPTPASVVLLGLVIFVVAGWAVSRSVEGPRRAKDRLATSVVTGAFALAMIPLVSLV
ncbi:phosphate ABC transporter, permease protein PstA, partial [Georgenia sp. 10Sc9-8]|nr:phosphate ABC transporter, permease protein PstA [Georgenia halotolerans]